MTTVEMLTTVAKASTPRVFIASWMVIALIGAAIIACTVMASLYANVAVTDLPIGP